MTLPEGRKPLLWKDMDFAQPVNRDQFNCLSGPHSTWEGEAKALYIAASNALHMLEQSRFSNAEHERAKEYLRAALQEDKP